MATKRTRGWNGPEAFRKALQTMRRLDADTPTDWRRELDGITDPVDRARKMAELASPADMALLIAIRHGVDADTAEAYRSQLRLVADIAGRSLSIVGLRAGDVQQFEPTERFRAFLDAWHQGDGAPAADDPPTYDVAPSADAPALPPAAPDPD
jgi:hypothetical protein